MSTTKTTPEIPKQSSQVAPTSRNEQFVYAGKAGIDIPCFDASKDLPANVKPTKRYLANFGMRILSPKDGFGMTGVQDSLDPIKKEIQKGFMSREETPTYMPPNLTRCRPDKDSDDFFTERRLNGLNPGQLKLVQNQPWRYVINYDLSKYSPETAGILVSSITSRFCFDGQFLRPHSIEYTLHSDKPETKIVLPGDSDWEWAKKLFRNAEFISHQTRTHLGKCHMNMDQYAMAYYRNIVNHPIKQLLEPHLEGLLNINKQGGTLIIGSSGFIPVTSTLNPEQINQMLKEEISNLTYRNFHPRNQALPDPIANNYFDWAAIAMWEVIEEYVNLFFKTNQAGIKANWSEIQRMSEDLVTRSILKPEFGKLDITSENDLKQLCVYVIYHSTFFHSWVHFKQYDDGGEPDYAAMGLWDKNHAKYNKDTENMSRYLQTSLMWALSGLFYNPIMASKEGLSTVLRDAIWKHRDRIEPGISLQKLMMSINI